MLYYSLECRSTPERVYATFALFFYLFFLTLYGVQVDVPNLRFIGQLQGHLKEKDVFGIGITRHWGYTKRGCFGFCVHSEKDNFEIGREMI